MRETTDPGADRDPPAVAYVYAPDRKASQPIAHLAGFKGVLQVDGYAGYRALAEEGEVSLRIAKASRFESARPGMISSGTNRCSVGFG